MNHTVALTTSAALLVLAGLPAYSQTTFATITGTVVDPSGAVMVGTNITATNRNTKVRTTAQSNRAGNYTMDTLKEGSYDVNAAAPGFKTFVVENVILGSRDERRLDIKMEVGSTDTQVEVSGGATLIETETARIDATHNALRMKETPVNNGRGIYAFLAITPTVLAGNSGAIKIAGSDVNQSHLAIDGTTFDDGQGSYLGPLGNYTEWIQEIRVDIADNSAEFGPLGHVTIISKSGSNQLHGSAKDYYVTPFFRARNPFALARATGVLHLYAVNGGGPVYIPKVYDGRNKTFFFVSMDRSSGGNSTTSLNPTVPLPAWRNGDFSSLAPGVLIYDPQTNQPFPGNQIPASRINAVSQTLQTRFYPLPNFGSSSVLQSQNFRENVTRPFDPTENLTGRIDHKFRDNDSIYGRVSYEQGYGRTYEDNLPTIGQRYQKRKDAAASASYTHIFTPSLINEFRWGAALNKNPFWGPVNGLQETQQLGLQGLAPNLPSLPGMFAVNWSGLGLQPLSQVTYNNPGYRSHLEEFQDHISWFRGRHILKFGFDLTMVQFNNTTSDPSLFGSATFSNRFSSGGITGQGNAYADFLLGIPTTLSRAFPPVETDERRWMYDFFALDEFKVNAKLTLTYGVRYELHTPWTQKNSLLSMFDIAAGKIVVPDAALSKVSNLMPAGYVGVVSATSVGLPQSLISTNTHDFAPRVGLAYRPWGATTVFRAGWGIYYNVAPQSPNVASLPFVINEPAFTNTLTNPVVLPQVFPSTGVGGPSTVSIPAAINPNLRMPYSFQYNATIEHQQWGTGFRLSYIGTATRENLWSYNYNSPLPSTVPFVNKPRPFPNYPNINYMTNGAGQQYNAMLFAVQRKVSTGLVVDASWTWARDRYDVGPADGPIEDPFSRQREIAVGPDTPTHRVILSWLYQLPFGKGHHWLSSAGRLENLLVGGWNISSVTAIYSGQFLTPLWTGPDPTNTAYTTSTTPAVVTVRPNELCNPNLPGGQRSVNAYYNVSCFGAPTPGQFGSSAKGVIKGPAVFNLDAGIYKHFAFSNEGTRQLIWEFTAFNILNRQNWSNPGLNVTSAASAGIISGVGGVNGGSIGDAPGARALLMALRLEF
jgi:Carboxypeptidase regulatory-like domain